MDLGKARSKEWALEAFGEGGKGIPAREGLGPMNQKREGLTPLQELDPNVLDQKRRRGKTQNKPTLEDEKQMDGDKAMAATQHRRAQ